MVLSGYVEPLAAEQAALPAHQFLTKPCEPKQLVAVIRQSLAAGALLRNERLRSVVSGIGSLPSLPSIYRDLTEEMAREQPSLQKVGKLVESDPGMAANVLKMVNSSFFGFTQHISSPQQAVTLLGLNTLRSLILSAHIFSSFDQGGCRLFSILSLWEHSLRTSRLCFKIAEAEGCAGAQCEDALAAGLLHDVGKLALAASMPADYFTVLDAVRGRGMRVSAAEIEHFGVSHAPVGGYLLSLWGLPEPVAAAVAGHHDPDPGLPGFPPVHAVYVGNIMDHRHYILNPGYAQPELDPVLLDRMGRRERVAQWDRITAEHISEEEDDHGSQDPHC